MEGKTDLTFGSFRLDRQNERLYRGRRELSLTPKAIQVLRYLIEHEGQLVKKDELLEAVWQETIVEESSLKYHIGQIRAALGDNSRKPHFIRTVHRLGYSFIAQVQQDVSTVAKGGLLPALFAPKPASPVVANFVGRQAELSQLQECYAKARGGERQIVLITGEAGIGKTALVDTFAASLVSDPTVWIGQGQCLELYGMGEAYLPVLEAFGQLGRGPEGELLIRQLKDYAPTWLGQLPFLLSSADSETLRQQASEVGRDQMLREMAEVVEVLTTDRTLVLVLEDLHWSDPSTTNLLAFLAHHRQSARLLVLGTYRPVNAIVKNHPMRSVQRELEMHNLCRFLALPYLPEEAVEDYFIARFGQSSFPPEFTPTIQKHVEGNPLFLVNWVDTLVDKQVVTIEEGQWRLRPNLQIEEVAKHAPERLQHLIAQQFEELSSDDQHILEAASVAGAEFSAAAVAIAVEADLYMAEEQCEKLARQGQFIQKSKDNTEDSPWLEETLVGRYQFIHALYQVEISAQLAFGKRQRLHHRIGMGKESGYGEHVGEIAAELAIHFDYGRDYTSALKYYKQTAARALSRSANDEAVSHLTKGLAMLEKLPQTPERQQQELSLYVMLGKPLTALKGYTAPEVVQVYARARALCQETPDSPQLAQVLEGLWAQHALQGNLQNGLDFAGQLLSLARRQNDTFRELGALTLIGATLSPLGRLEEARQHFEHAIDFYNPKEHDSYDYTQHPQATSLCRLAEVLWLLGYPTQALQKNTEALDFARQLNHDYSVSYVLFYTVILHCCRREQYAAQEQAEELIVFSQDRQFKYRLTQGRLLEAWIPTQYRAGEADMEHLQQYLAEIQASGTEVYRPYYLLLLAEGYRRLEQPGEGLAMVDEALAVIDKTEERFYEAELYRLKGELLQQTEKNPHRIDKAAEQCFQQALAISRSQQAKSLELRAATSLSRLWQRKGKHDQARQLLEGVYSWFTEGFDTADLQDAKALLAELK